jgi:hypothetical protein
MFECVAQLFSSALTKNSLELPVAAMRLNTISRLVINQQPMTSPGLVYLIEMLQTNTSLRLLDISSKSFNPVSDQSQPSKMKASGGERKRTEGNKSKPSETKAKRK